MSTYHITASRELLTEQIIWPDLFDRDRLDVFKEVCFTHYLPHMCAVWSRHHDHYNWLVYVRCPDDDREFSEMMRVFSPCTEFNLMEFGLRCWSRSDRDPDALRRYMGERIQNYLRWREGTY